MVNIKRRMMAAMLKKALNDRIQIVKGPWFVEKARVIIPDGSSLEGTSGFSVRIYDRISNLDIVIVLIELMNSEIFKRTKPTRNNIINIIADNLVSYFGNDKEVVSYIASIFRSNKKPTPEDMIRIMSRRISWLEDFGGLEYIFMCDNNECYEDSSGKYRVAIVQAKPGGSNKVDFNIRSGVYALTILPRNEIAESLIPMEAKTVTEFLSRVAANMF